MTIVLYQLNDLPDGKPFSKWHNFHDVFIEWFARSDDYLTLGLSDFYDWDKRRYKGSFGWLLLREAVRVPEDVDFVSSILLCTINQEAGVLSLLTTSGPFDLSIVIDQSCFVLADRD